MSRNYARLLATVALGSITDASEPFATQISIPLPESNGRNLHGVGHA